MLGSPRQVARRKVSEMGLMGTQAFRGTGHGTQALRGTRTGHGTQALRGTRTGHAPSTPALVGDHSHRHARGRHPEPTVSVVIPAKNEARNLPAVLGALPAGLHEVILVDGNSTDDTVAVARACCPGIVVIQQSRKGKGNALACGFAAATGDFLVMLDADGSTDPEEIPRFVAALEQGADFAKGSRFMPGAGSSDISRLRQAGNFWLSTIVNLLYGTRYTDLCYGYNAFRRDCLQEIDLDASARTDVDPTVMLWGDGFEVETLINVRIAKAGLRVLEVPSFESRRVFGKSKLHAFSDGLRVLQTIRIEHRWGARRAAAGSRTVSRRDDASWSILSTSTLEAS